jgi:hypothetical protein
MYLFFITFYIISPYTDNNDDIHLYSSPDCFISHFQTILNISIIDGRILKVIIPYFIISCVEFKVAAFLCFIPNSYLPLFYCTVMPQYTEQKILLHMFLYVEFICVFFIQSIYLSLFYYSITSVY